MKKYLMTVIITILAISTWTGPVMAYDVEGIDIHGFISQGYLRSGEYNYLANGSTGGSFEYNEMGINFSKQLNDKLRVGLQFFSRDVGDVANNKITVDWAYADYRFKDWFGMRVGKIKLPMGLYNETRDADMLRTCIILPQGIYNDLLRDNLIALTGVSGYGNRDMNTLGSISYALIAGVLPSDTEGGTNKYLGSKLSASGMELSGDYDPGTSYAGSLFWETPLEGLKFGYSFFHTRNSGPLVVTAIFTAPLEGVLSSQILSVEYAWDNLVLAAEYMERESTRRILTSESTATLQSYYFLASYAFNDWFTLGSYYSVVYPDKDDKDGLNLPIDHMAWEKDIALTLRFDINEYWVLKVEGHRVDGTTNVLTVDNPGNTYAESDFFYGAAKITVSF